MTVMTVQHAKDLLKELLLVGGWQNNSDTIVQAFPHFEKTLGKDDLLQTLGNLNVPYTVARCRESKITEAECPALVFHSSGECYVALDVVEGKVLSADPTGGAPVQRVLGHGLCTVIRIEKFAFQPARQENLTVWQAFKTIRELVPGLLSAAFMVNLLGLFAPLLIMAIYDRVIPSGSVDLLMALAAGVAILATADFLFRAIRTRALAYVGQKGERALATALFRKLMRLPLVQLQKSGTPQQIARFRQFESLREMFTGQIITTLIDLPFAVIFMAVLIYLAPSVGFFTCALVILLLTIGIISLPFQQQLDLAAAEASRASNMVMQDAISHQRTLVNLGMQDRWLERSLPLASAAEAATAKARQLRNLLQNLSQSIVALGSVGAIVLSAHSVVAGNMSFGALIASIALVSKLLAPVQAFQSSLVQVSGFRKSQRQADMVLSLKEETELGVSQSHQKTLCGDIAFRGVSYRPEAESPSLLTAIDFSCQPGELVVIMGHCVSGRTALLDLAGGLVTPSGGVIEHDGIDIRQIASDELRRSVTYATYDPNLFPGTINQNFRLAAPALSQEQINTALQDMGLQEKISRLPKGSETYLDAQTLSTMSEARIKSLALARSIARETSIYLFSEPTEDLSQQRRVQFKAWLEEQRGKKTVLIATADRSFMKMADRLVYLNGDRMVVNDTGPTAKKKVEAVMKAMGA